MYTAAFDLTTTSRDELVDLLRRWTTMSARLTAGLSAGPFGATGGPDDAPPDDTGEALDLPPAGLTITIGFGRSLFVGPGTGRRRRPIRPRRAAARPASSRLPHFPGDDLDPARSDGDLIVQACADDPQVAMHAVRNLTRTAFGTARVRWSQLGFGRTSSTSTAQATPRNLLGFKDGTANIKAEETADVERPRLGPAGRSAAPGMAGRRDVRRRAPDPDGDRDLGPLVAARAGGDHRPRQGRRRPAVGRDRVHRARLRRDRRRRRSR